MRRSEFQRAVADEFGSRADTVTRDLTLRGVGGLTAVEAIDAGENPRAVWLALCEETDVAPDRRYGAGRLEARQ